MSGTVYLVTSGEYSDYGVDAAFTTRERADKYVAAGLGDSVLEMDLDFDLTPLDRGLLPFKVYRYPDGRFYTSKYAPPLNEEVLEHPDGAWMVTQLWAENAAAARKVSAERFGRWRAAEGIERPRRKP